MGVLSMRRQPGYLYPAYCVLLFAIGAAMAVRSLSTPGVPLSIWRWALLASVATFMTFIGMRLPEGPSLPASAAVSFAVLLYYGPFALFPIIVISQLVFCTVKERKLLEFLFNCGQLSICAVVFTNVYELAGGNHVFSPFADLAPMVPAFLAYWATNALAVSLSLSLRENCSSGQMVLRIGRSLLMLTPSVFAIGIVMAHAYAGSLAGFLSVCFAVSLIMALADRYFRLYGNLHESYLRTLCALTSLIDLRDPQTSGHSARVAQYTRALAEQLGLPKKQIDDLHVAALFHDIGKIGLSERILNKSGPLTIAEIRKIREHPVTGYEVAVKADLPEEIARAIRYHHERYDGSGYPEGLKGNDIPFFARILALADCYDAMTSDRSYRATVSHEAALAEVRAGSGTQFDPSLVPAFLESVKAGQPLDSTDDWAVRAGAD